MTSPRRHFSSQKRRRRHVVEESSLPPRDDDFMLNVTSVGLEIQEDADDRITSRKKLYREMDRWEGETSHTIDTCNGEWLLCRHGGSERAREQAMETDEASTAAPNSTNPSPQKSSSYSNQSMVLRSNLGNPSDMVDSLVDRVENWSLTRVKSNVVTPEKVDATSSLAAREQRRQAQKDIKRALLASQSPPSLVK